MTKATLLGVYLLVGTSLTASGQIIDHRSIDGVAGLPQTTMAAVGQQKWLFTHASVGGNMVSGMNDLHASNPSRYQLVPASTSFDSAQQRASNPPSPTLTGRIYECNRGNPGWSVKFTIFANSLNLGGWHAPAVNVCMDKLCYIDQNASAATYLSTMAGLETAYPTTVFVYTTMPLMTGSGSDNILRNNYNAAVRDYCTANRKLLFDIADIEAHDSAGNPVTFSSGGQTYQSLYSGYSSDGGHLNTAGCQRVATGWYAVAAAIVGTIPGDLNLDGVIDNLDLSLFVACASGACVPHNGTLTCMRADADGDNDVDAVDFAVLQRSFSPAP